jgi:Spy/CpxP family protein refolding chaperone
MSGEIQMTNNEKRKWQVRVATLLIFVVGFGAGALAMNVYRRWQRPPGRQERERFVKLLDSLQLTEDQKKQAHEVLADTRGQLTALRKESEPRVAEIRRQADERLQKILTPDQWKQFQQERDKLRRDRRGRENSSGTP